MRVPLYVGLTVKHVHDNNCEFAIVTLIADGRVFYKRTEVSMDGTVTWNRTISNMCECFRTYPGDLPLARPKGW